MAEQIYDKKFHQLELANEKLERAEYDQCTFTNCNFERADIGNCVFLECNFTDCNLSNAVVRNTAFREVEFNNCKLLGVHFQEANTFLLQIHFIESKLDFSSFTGLQLQSSRFQKCSLKEVDLSEANCTGLHFYECLLAGATFDNSNLEKADFSTAHHFSIDPERNSIKKATFTLNGLQGLLAKHQIVVK